MDTLFCTGQELARGTYAIVQLDPVAACADANDPEITLLAKQLPSKKYLAIINRCGFMQKPQWGVYVVSQGLPTPDKDYGLHEGMCTPIFPTTEHPQAREPLRPNKEFPWKNCYHHSFPGYQILAVSSISREGASGIKLPEEEMRRLNDCFLTDSYEARETRERNEELLMNNRAQNSGDQVVNPRIHLSCEEDSEMLSPEGLPPLLPSTGPTLPGSSDPNEEDAAEPYDNFSDVTSCISGTSAEFSYTDGDEGFIRDPGSSADSVWILPTMKVWLDLSVIDSQTLPPVADFRAEVREISNLYIKWKERQEAQEGQSVTKKVCRDSVGKSATATETVESTHQRGWVRKAARSVGHILQKLLPCGLFSSQKDVGNFA